MQVSRKHRGTKIPDQEQKFDQSTRCREAIEEAGTFSIDPPGIEEVSRLLKNSFFKKGKNTYINAIKHATQPRIQSTF